MGEEMKKQRPISKDEILALISAHLPETLAEQVQAPIWEWTTDRMYPLEEGLHQCHAQLRGVDAWRGTVDAKLADQDHKFWRLGQMANTAEVPPSLVPPGIPRKLVTPSTLPFAFPGPPVETKNPVPEIKHVTKTATEAATETGTETGTRTVTKMGAGSGSIGVTPFLPPSRAPREAGEPRVPAYGPGPSLQRRGSGDTTVGSDGGQSEGSARSVHQPPGGVNPFQWAQFSVPPPSQSRGRGQYIAPGAAPGPSQPSQQYAQQAPGQSAEHPAGRGYGAAAAAELPQGQATPAYGSYEEPPADDAPLLGRGRPAPLRLAGPVGKGGGE